jgi:hypothetical protein
METNDRILLFLADIKGELGEFRAEGRSRDSQLRDIRQLLSDHVAADNKVAHRVSDLEHSRSRTRGMLIVVSAAGGLIASVGVAIAKALL